MYPTQKIQQMEAQQGLKANKYEHKIIDHDKTSGCIRGWKVEIQFPAEKFFVLKIRKTHEQKFNELQQNTFIPRTLRNLEIVVIKGDSLEDVIAAKKRVVEFFACFPNHLVRISFATHEMISNFESFKDKVIREHKLPYKLLRNPNKLQYVFMCIDIKDEEDKVKAAECLKLCKEEIIESRNQLTVKLTGVRRIRNNIHLKILQQEEFEKIIEIIQRRFHDMGFADLNEAFKSERLSYKGNLIRTAYIMNPNKEDGIFGPYKYVPYNSNAILDDFKDFHFGSLNVIETLEIYPTRSKDREVEFPDK